VAEIFKEAYKKNGSFHVYICESAPDRSGTKMAEDLRKIGLQATVILDAAVGMIMEKIDFVLLGAEGVVDWLVRSNAQQTGLCSCRKF
jgi:translation initiation factor eIF-2B subunit alpha